MTKCSATIEFGDDEGDNMCTMNCQRERDHTGFHSESATLRGGQRYLVTWEDELIWDATHPLQLLKQEEVLAWDVSGGDK